MANIKLNGQSSFENTTCLSFAPTILEVSSNASGSYTVFQLDFGSFDGLDYATEYNITINNVVLTMVRSVSEAKGYRFYMDTAYTSTQRKLMVNTLLNAIKRIPEVVAGYDVYMPNSNGEKSLQIIVKSKTYGNNTPLKITTNIPFITQSTTTGTASTELKKGNLCVDVYKRPIPTKYGTTADGSGNYVTTLSKHTSNDKVVKYDIGSVFASLTEEGEASQFGLLVYMVGEDGLTEIGNYTNIYNVGGYMINQGGEYLPTFENARIAMNVGRGENREYLNNTLLYVYENSIPMSLYVANGVNTISYKIHYVGSDNTDITAVGQTVPLTSALSHFTINLVDSYLTQSKYIDIEFTQYNLGTLRYNVIKPIKATDEIQRVYWYNSWGGVSFFDFTGNRTEERKVKVTTYQQSLLNYYDNDTNERDMVYDKENEITVKLTSHNIHKDGQWTLFDLQNSRVAWSYVNGKKYRIIVDDLTINTTNVTDIYTATISYTYSLGVNI